MKTIKELLGMCLHEWEIDDEIDVYSNNYGQLSKLPTGTKYILKCKKCGDIKVVRT